MNISRRNLLSTAVLALLITAPHGLADTVFTNADGTDSLISNALNWDNGLPTGQQGTIGINAVYDGAVTHTGYNVIHSAGNLALSGINPLTLSGGTWLMNGTATFGGRGLKLTNSSSFEINKPSGDANFSSNNRDITLETSSLLTLNSGNLIGGRSLNVNNATFTMNGGAVSFSTAAYVGTTGLGANGILNLNGGTLNADRLALRGATAVNFGGSSAGTATFTDWGTGLYTNTGDRAQDNAMTLNFLFGTGMVLSLSETARGLDFTNDSTDNPYGTAWAQALWENDQLLYDGQSATDLGGLSWANASNSATGLGGGVYFDFTPAGTYGGSLGLAVIPEPSSLVLLGLAAVAVAGLRRRRG